jgi:hypothetical protein
MTTYFHNGVATSSTSATGKPTGDFVCHRRRQGCITLDCTIIDGHTTHQPTRANTCKELLQ